MSDWANNTESASFRRFDCVDMNLFLHVFTYFMYEVEATLNVKFISSSCPMANFSAQLHEKPLAVFRDNILLNMYVG